MFKTKIRWYKLVNSKSVLMDQIPDLGLKNYYLNSTNICIARNGTEFFAVRDKCPHQGKSFSAGGCVEDGKVVCPWHRYGFDLKNGRGAGLYVEVYPLEEREDGIYIGFEYFSWW